MFLVQNPVLVIRNTKSINKGWIRQLLASVGINNITIKNVTIKKIFTRLKNAALPVNSTCHPLFQPFKKRFFKKETYT